MILPLVTESQYSCRESNRVYSSKAEAFALLFTPTLYYPSRLLKLALSNYLKWDSQELGAADPVRAGTNEVISLLLGCIGLDVNYSFIGVS